MINNPKMRWADNKKPQQMLRPDLKKKGCSAFGLCAMLSRTAKRGHPKIKQTSEARRVC